MTLPIGGADMPVVISIYNACTGVAVGLEGFVLQSPALMIAGMVVGAAGTLITLVGGTLASTMGAFSALAQWALVQPDLGSEVRALHLLAFATGGPGYVVPFGLLVAGVAVTGGLSRKLPRWVMWSGLFVAGAAELSSLSIAFAPAMYLLPLARFTGLVWLVVVGALLPSTRASQTPHQAPEPTLRKALERA